MGLQRDQGGRELRRDLRQASRARLAAQNRARLQQPVDQGRADLRDADPLIACDAMILMDAPFHSVVVPGLGDAESPESMNTGLWNMASGLGPSGRPGMTIKLMASESAAIRLRPSRPAPWRVSRLRG